MEKTLKLKEVVGFLDAAKIFNELTRDPYEKERQEYFRHSKTQEIMKEGCDE